MQQIIENSATADLALSESFEQLEPFFNVAHLSAVNSNSLALHLTNFSQKSLQPTQPTPILPSHFFVPNSEQVKTEEATSSIKIEIS